MSMRNFDIDFSNLNPVQGCGQYVIHEAPSALTQQFKMHKYWIIHSMPNLYLQLELVKTDINKQNGMKQSCFLPHLVLNYGCSIQGFI